MSSRSTSVGARGLSLAVQIAGDPGRPGCVLLHGWPQCRRLWDPVLDALARDLFVLAFDLPDVGESRGA
jgi:pimeloyl-ACP methyl ester carboxylesterase